jgi:hypothetical protein
MPSKLTASSATTQLSDSEPPGLSNPLQLIHHDPNLLPLLYLKKALQYEAYSVETKKPIDEKIQYCVPAWKSFQQNPVLNQVPIVSSKSLKPSIRLFEKEFMRASEA